MNPEERIGAAVSAWLTSAGWTVYAEVMVPAAGKRRADIVAVREGEVWIVECKTCLSWQAIAQSEAWEGWAHYRSVATAAPRPSAAVNCATRAMFLLGITWLHVGVDGVDCGFHGPQVARRAPLVLDALRPEHRDARPGTASGEHYTQTQERDARLRALVAAQPGVELREALSALGLRLGADERRLLATALCRGRVDGVAGRRDGRRVFLTETESVL